jgi:hypothetical protein
MLWSKFIKLFVRKQITRQLQNKTSQSASSVGASQFGARCQIWETDYLSGICWLREISWINPLRAYRWEKTVFLQLMSKNNIWNNANNWGNIICKQKNQRKKWSKQLTKYPFKELTFQVILHFRWKSSSQRCAPWWQIIRKPWRRLETSSKITGI